MVTPKEMREQTEKAREQARQRALEQREKQQAAYAKKLEEIMNLKESFIQRIEKRMKDETHVVTSVSVVVNKCSSWSDRDDYKPVLQAVVDHFKDQGFKSRYYFDNQTEYYGDGAGPGEDHQVITVDWSV